MERVVVGAVVRGGKSERVLVVVKHRPTLGASSLELPCGVMGPAHHDPGTFALQLVRERAGLSAVVRRRVPGWTAGHVKVTFVAL